MLVFHQIIYLGMSNEGGIKSNVILFRTSIITNTGTCIIHQNEAGPLWITSLLLHIVTISLNSNVPPSNESMYPCPVKYINLVLCGSHPYIVTT